ncbi:MAG: relaxase, partial [Oscillospiraceae bacterium]|nr:relaxase [Oscillospiraceae bacterium]
GVKKIPTIKKLQAEYAEILTEKKKDYAEYRQLRSEMRQLLTAKANVDRLLGYDEKQKEVKQVKESPIR